MNIVLREGEWSGCEIEAWESCTVSIFLSDRPPFNLSNSLKYPFRTGHHSIGQTRPLRIAIENSCKHFAYSSIQGQSPKLSDNIERDSRLVARSSSPVKPPHMIYIVRKFLPETPKWGVGHAAGGNVNVLDVMYQPPISMVCRRLACWWCKHRTPWISALENCSTYARPMHELR